MKYKESKKKKLMILLIVVILLAALGCLFFIRWISDGETSEDTDGQTAVGLNQENGQSREPEIERGEDGLLDYSTADPEDFPTSTENGSEEKTAVEAPTEEFQGKLNDSSLIINGIQPYDGIFIEMKEDTECENVAAASLENRSDKMITLAQVVIKAGDTKWEFEASTIPAGATVIVQEKNAKQYVNTEVSCEKVNVAYEEEPSLLEEQISVEEISDTQLKITNISEEDISVLRLFYKLKEEDIYIGGITYTVKLENLSAGESQTISPAHYLKGYSEILMIKKYEE